MSDPFADFHEFERRGWQQEDTARHYDAFFAQVTTQTIEPLLDAATVARGALLLDVACGAGYVAGAAAGRGAKATGVDFSAAQIALGRRRYPDIAFEEGDAEALPFEAGRFDAIVCNFGMPHLPHPPRAIAEAFRVLRRGGRFAFTAWTKPPENIGFGVIYGAIRAHGDMNVPLPPGPDFFLYGDPDECRRGLADSGFAAATVMKVPQLWRLPDADALFHTVRRGSVRAAALLKAQAPDALARIRAAMREDVARFVTMDGGIALPMGALVSAGYKP
jgi:SAM-dependent methyltransferase